MKRIALRSANLTLALAAAHAASPAELLAGYSAQAGAPPQAVRGQRMFVSRHSAT